MSTGEIERQWSSHLGEGLDDRLAADYAPAYSSLPKRRVKNVSEHKSLSNASDAICSRKVS
jgi:hypothetical protein